MQHYVYIFVFLFSKNIKCRLSSMSVKSDMRASRQAWLVDVAEGSIVETHGGEPWRATAIWSWTAERLSG